MSAIGDYIHYHKRNYKLWGTSKVGRRNTGDITRDPVTDNYYWNVFPHVKKDGQELMMEAKYLEEEYNKLFYPSEGEVSARTQEFRKSLQETIQKKLDKEFGSVAGSFNLETLSVDTNALHSELNNAIRETKNRLKTAIVSKNITASNMLKQVERMYNILNQQEFRGIAEIQSRIIETQNQLKNIRSNLLEEINATGGNTRVQNIEDVQTLSNIIQEFNRVPLLYKQNKVVFEWLAPFIKIQTASIAKQELAKTMESLASSDIKVEIDSQEKQKGEDININIGNDVNIRTASSDQNSQITIEYKDKTGNLQKSSILAKNIKTASTEIQLLNQTSLYQLLALSNRFNFANHYLNLVASAKNQTSSEADILMANKLLKTSILSLAINNYNSIDFLVINDYKKRKIFVYSINLLLYLIEEEIKYGDTSKYSGIITLEDDYTIPNNWEDTVGERIGKILINTRNKKVSGMITPGMFNIYKNALRTGRT